MSLIYLDSRYQLKDEPKLGSTTAHP